MGSAKDRAVESSPPRFPGAAGQHAGSDDAVLGSSACDTLLSKHCGAPLLKQVVLGAQAAGWSDQRHFRTVAMRELSRPPALALGGLAGGGMGIPLQQGSQGFPVLGGGLGGRGLGVPQQQGSQGFPVLSAGFLPPPQVPLMPHLLL